MLTLTKQGVEQQNPYCCVINYSEKKMSARACSAGLRRVHHSHSHFKRFSVTHTVCIPQSDYSPFREINVVLALYPPCDARVSRVQRNPNY